MHNFSTNRILNPLTNDQMHRMAPAIFANAPHEKMSDRYAFIPTIQVVDVLRAQGWNPVKVMGTRGQHAEASRHMIKFQREATSQVSKIGDSVAEITLVNAHNGTSQYELIGGLFRLVCLNGLMAGENVESYKIKHIGYKDDQVIEAQYKVLESMPKIAENVELMRSIELNSGERLALAEAALITKFGEENNKEKDVSRFPITAEQLLLTRRSDDRKNDLWTTFNAIQENIIRGGLQTARNENNRRSRTREVTSVSENVRLNRALWTLADRMAALKTA